MNDTDGFNSYEMKICIIALLKATESFLLAVAEKLTRYKFSLQGGIFKDGRGDI